MAVIVDVFLAVAVIAVTPGAVPELQLRVGNVCPSAYSAAVRIGSLCGIAGAFFVKRDRSGSGRSCLSGSVFSTELTTQPEGQKIDNILSGEQKIVAQCHQRKQVVGEIKHRIAQIEHGSKCQKQIDQRHDPCFDGDYKEQSKMTVRIGRGECQDQTQMQIVRHILINADGGI